jgi:hypothetical protein
MKADESARLIDKAGGNAKFAELLGLTGKPNFQQMIYNWRKRGIPATVELAHLDKLKMLSGNSDAA